LPACFGAEPAEVIVPALSLTLIVAMMVGMARAAGEQGPGCAAVHGLVLAPLLGALALAFSSVRSRLRQALSPAWAAGTAVLAATLYLSGMAALQPAGQATASVASWFLVPFLGLPFLLFWPRGQTPVLGWRDAGFTAAVFLLAHSKLTRVSVVIGARNGEPYVTDAGFYVWLLLLLVYLLLVRGLDLGYSLRLDWRDLGWFVGLLAALVAVLLPAAWLGGMVGPLPGGRPASELLYAAYRYLFRIALPEELVFRLVLQTLMVGWAVARWGERSGGLAGWLAASLLFGLVHLPRGLAFTGLACVAGLGYGWAYRTTGRLTAPVLLHAGLDLVYFMLRPV
jgi:membrane protease YdiL (CAAX protease family)